MYRYLGLSFSYILYLLILGQGCSALKGVDHVVSVPIPNLEAISKVRPISFPEIKSTKAPLPASEVIVERDLPLLKDRVSEVKSAPSKRKQMEILTIQPIKKNYKIIEGNHEVISSEDEELTDEDLNEYEEAFVASVESRLSNDPGINHFGFNHKSEVEIVNISDAYGSGIEQLLANIEEDSKIYEEEAKLANTTDNPIKVGQEYNPTDPSILESFEAQKIDLNAIQDFVKKKESSTSERSDEIVLIDYSNQEEEKHIANINENKISETVTAAIQRELKPVSKSANLVAQAKPTLSMPLPGMVPLLATQGAPQKKDSRRKSQDQKSRMTIMALEGHLGSKVNGIIQNFSFVPSFNENDALEDFNEGEIDFDYSLRNETGIIRGALVKNYFVRTMVELPLGNEYSKVEVPLISQESLGDFIDKHELSGYGGYYIIDLGELIQDVEIEKAVKSNGYAYERRFLLNENLKVVGSGKDFRYVLFAGVEPGNVNVKYLGINGQETSKLTFIAPDEITFDLSQLQRPIEFEVSTTLQHTLGKTAKDLDLNPERIIQIETGEKAQKTSPSHYLLKSDWSIRGTRTYIEVGHLEDPLFVGIDGDKRLELPSLEFVQELLKAFGLEGLNSECLLQVNFSSKIRDVRVFGENARGPAVFDLNYLDRDGIFSPDLSPLSEKLMILGNEEGIFNIYIEYENGTQDYLRTFCSTSSYLLEQL